MSDIFLSYAREDLRRAELVARALERCGWSVWWDRRILAGAPFDDVIERELAAAAAVVVLWSQASVPSRWVRAEATEADARGKIVPARLDDVQPPLAFRGLQAPSLIDWDGDPAHEGFQAVRDAVRDLVDRARAKPSAGTAEAVESRTPPLTRRPAWMRVALVVPAALAVAYLVLHLAGLEPWRIDRPASPAPSPSPSASPTPTPATGTSPTDTSPAPSRSPTPAVDPGRQARLPSYVAETPYRPGMRFIDAGTFTMGSPADEDGRRPEETPHQVTLSRPFYMAESEVTQGQYQAVMADNPSAFGREGPTHPVENVSWFMALEYCNELSARESREACYVVGGDDVAAVRWAKGLDCTGYRLPTEAEWEYAARALSDGSRYDNLDDIAWYKGNSGGRTRPVGSKPPNRWGLRDTLGNVYEWVWDVYAAYPPGPVRDPLGPSLGNVRVFRGCCWDNVPNVCRAAFRDYRDASVRAHGLGLRPVRTAR